MRSKFDEQLELLHKEMILMGSMCENAIALAARGLLENDKALCAKVGELSSGIDHKEREIEGMCIKLLMQQQPVAGDLRVISSALKMVTDMERIGDQSADISEIAKVMQIPPFEDISIIRKMAESVIKMVTDSIDAFVKRNEDAAYDVIKYDDVVDACFTEAKNYLISRLSEIGGEGDYLLDILMIVKYFERIGDHAANIAKWVIFGITGRQEVTSE